MHTSTAPADISDASAVVSRLRLRLTAAIRGRDEAIEATLIALLAEGHLLLEDFPGSGKTTLARALGEAIVAADSPPNAAGPNADDRSVEAKPGAPLPAAASANGQPRELPAFRRIQFTPDLLPSDITGTTLFEPETRTFRFRHGPLFAHIVLADEINRTSPKVQSALLEAMAERQVTVDDETHPLDELFFVIATQNPLDLAGTYPLPAPQLDRFLFRLRMEAIAPEAELELLLDYPTPRLSKAHDHARVSRGELLAVRRSMRTLVHVDRAVREAMASFARELRADERVLQGVSTRSLMLLMPALQARALLAGRDFVAPEDLHALLPLVYNHRLETAAGHAVGDVILEHSQRCIESLTQKSLRKR